MASDKRLLVGSSFGTGEEYVNFLSNRNFHESNVAIWKPSAVIGEMSSSGPSVQQTTIATLERRLAHLSEWVTQGHTLILIDHAPALFRYKVQASVRTLVLETYAPLDGISFTVAAGTRVEYCGPPSFADLLASHIPLLKYEVVLTADDLKPLLKVASGSPGVTQVVGGYRHHGKGVIFYLPGIKGSPSDWASYINDASKLTDALLCAPSDFPPWVDQYQTDGDKNAFARISELTVQIADLENQLKTQHDLLTNSRELKRLAFDTGAGFTSSVEAALTELGLSVVEGPHPRADLLASDGNRYAAIEAKGVDGATKERDVRQAVQWMAEVDSALASGDDEIDPDLSRYAAQLAKLSVDKGDNDCKGLLIMGTFRKQPLNERRQPSFPEPVIRVLERADVCALTGLQLLGLILMVRNNPSLRPVILKELFDTRGPLQRAQDWREFLDPPDDSIADNCDGES